MPVARPAQVNEGARDVSWSFLLAQNCQHVPVSSCMLVLSTSTEHDACQRHPLAPAIVELASLEPLWKSIKGAEDAVGNAIRTWASAGSHLSKFTACRS